MKTFRAIEALARLEQRKQLKKGKFVTMFNTHTVQSMCHKDKECFFNYLKARKRAVRLAWFLLLVSFFGFLIFRFGITGASVFGTDVAAVSWVFAVVFLAVLLIAMLLRVRNRSVDRRLKEYVAIAEKYI